MPERLGFWLVLMASIGASLGWFGYAVITHQPLEAGRGGSVGLAVALGLAFVTRDYGRRLYTALSKEWPELSERLKQLREGKERPRVEKEITVASLEQRIENLALSVEFDSQGKKVENIFLAVATLTGTLIDGLGDIFARWCIANVLPRL